MTDLNPVALQAAFDAADKASPVGNAFAPGITAGITAYLESLRAQGFVEVPKEPTEAMVSAYFKSIDAHMHLVETSPSFGRHDNMRLAYRAMLDAYTPAPVATASEDK